MNEVTNVRVANLRAGMVLTASGFTVTHNAWAGVRTPKGKMNIEGFYPNRPNSTHIWNRNTVVQVLDNN